jgi:hypothetical protein
MTRRWRVSQFEFLDPIAEEAIPQTRFQALQEEDRVIDSR